ncbi:hypothetical protein PT974_12259 [Cladobotryum mycophilum]|uniref:BZIP domain-containing protein n=1 Tax=Cladobotryum mycophilum TaxID=491253 RepID=A0ABR0S7H6_9HYPO
MPRLSVTQEARVQNRECQRRSRARRRELIDDLKKRVEEYERKGVEASREMQEAARRVNIENQRLKQLLNLRGVSEDEIQQYLSSSEISSQATSSASHPQPFTVRGMASETVSVDFESTSIGRKSLDNQAEKAESPLEQLVETPDDDHLDLAVSPSPGDENTCQEQQGSRERLQSPGFTSPTSPKVKYETSCDTAAAILVQLHANTDDERARAALGCTGTNNCSVKNTEFFQLMDTLC